MQAIFAAVYFIFNKQSFADITRAEHREINQLDILPFHFTYPIDCRYIIIIYETARHTSRLLQKNSKIHIENPWNKC